MNEPLINRYLVAGDQHRLNYRFYDSIGTLGDANCECSINVEFKLIGIYLPSGRNTIGKLRDDRGHFWVCYDCHSVLAAVPESSFGSRNERCAFSDSVFIGFFRIMERCIETDSDWTVGRWSSRYTVWRTTKPFIIGRCFAHCTDGGCYRNRGVGFTKEVSIFL